MKCYLRVVGCSILLLSFSTTAQAQRRLTWDAVDVTASLDRDGTLTVEEEQAMLFTGDWNGGARRFSIRPRQRLEFIDIARQTDSGWQLLREDSDIDDVDEFAWTAQHTLRWRSRLASDPSFDRRAIRYRIRYKLSGILVKDGDRFLLDHDFLFPERDGAIDRFSLKLALAPEWRPDTTVQETYTVASIAPGRGFVVRLPLRYAGAGAPAIRDTSRPREIVAATLLLLAFTGVALAWFFIREQRLGRFVPGPAAVDEAWLRAHVFSQPAEVVGATWDDGIAAAEVVALMARLESEGKLESDLSDKAMTLRLVADRASLEGYERTLVDKLFVNSRTTTTPAIVKAHYRKQGLNPADEIRKDLGLRVDALLGPRGTSRILGVIVFILAITGCGMLFLDWQAGRGSTFGTPVVGIAALILMGVAWGRGAQFRANIHWGPKRAWVSLAPGLAAVGVTAAFLWFYVGPGEVDVTILMARALAMLASAVLLAAIAAGRSRRSRQAIAFRKKLAAGREFMVRELAKPDPALRNEWMPWLLAFGLAKQVDDWSAQASAGPVSIAGSRGASAGGWSGTSSSGGGWTGFGGGRSGGAGATAAWTAAAGDFAAGVSAESSGGSGGGGGGGGGSSSGGSSGGGGGGGW